MVKPVAESLFAVVLAALQLWRAHISTVNSPRVTDSRVKWVQTAYKHPTILHGVVVGMPSYEFVGAAYPAVVGWLMSSYLGKPWEGKLW